MQIGLIGAGRMGTPIIERLRQAGHKVTALLRRAEEQSAATAVGLEWRMTPEQTVSGADAVFCVVLDDAQVRNVCLGPHGAIAAMKPGAILVQHTTCDPATVRLLGEEARQRDVHVLDAALSGGPGDIAVGSLTLWVGGDKRILQKIRGVLETYASPIQFVGPIGSGQQIKLVNNALFVAQLGLAIDAVRLAGVLGIEEADAIATLLHGSGTSRALQVLSRSGSPTGLAANIGPLMAKDLIMVRHAAEAEGADLGLIGEVLSSRTVGEIVLGRKRY